MKKRYPDDGTTFRLPCHPALSAVVLMRRSLASCGIVVVVCLPGFISFPSRQSAVCSRIGVRCGFVTLAGSADIFYQDLDLQSN